MMSLILEELSSSPNQHAGIQQNGAASGPNFESETAADGGTLSNRTKLLSLTNAIQTRYDRGNYCMFAVVVCEADLYILMLSVS